MTRDIHWISIPIAPFQGSIIESQQRSQGSALGWIIPARWA
jgi:hypothetical protein